MNYRFVIFFFCLAATRLSLSSQELFFSKYTVSEGLVNNSIRKIYQDRKGFLWISTWEGLSKYDGHRFTNFTESNGLSHNLVNDITETPNGDIYVAMNNGSVDIISNDRVKQREVFKNVIINKFESAVNGDLIALTDNSGIIAIDKKNIIPVTQTNGTSYYNLVRLNDSLIAAAADTLPVFVFDRKFHVWASGKNRLNKGIVANCIFIDQQHRIWLGTSQGLKFVTVDYKKNEIQLQEPPAPFNSPLLSQVNISSFLQQENGNFWIGTNRGLINVLPNDHIRQLTENNGLPSRDVHCIFNDRENNLWIGTGSGLAKMIAASPVQVHDPSQVTPNFALLIKKISSQHVLIHSGGFLNRYNFQSGEANNILALKKDKSLVYVSNSIPSLFIYEKKLNVYDIKSNKLRTVSPVMPPEPLLSATTINNQTIFLGSFNGVMIYANGKTTKDTSFDMRINNMLTDTKQYIWIGTWSDGLFRAKYDAIERRLIQVTAVQLPDKHIRSLFEDRNGNVWVGTRYSGVVRITEKEVNNFELLHFNQQTGLASNWIKDIAEDEKGNIWLASMSGVDKLVKKSGNFVVFNYSRIINFFTTVDFVTPTAENKLLCASSHGIFQIKDEQLEQLAPQQVYLTKITLGDNTKRELVPDYSFNKFELPHSKNHALFEFTTPVYLNEKEILYSYRLKGSGDTVWSRPSNSHSVQYASLKPGHYRFEVRMLGWNGINGPVTSFGFTVKPPFWNTWWFYSMVFVLAVLLLYIMYRYRINQLLRLQKVRNTIATDLHDDIGSTLTNISILSELGKKNLATPPVAKEYLQRITEESVASQQALDDIIWSVNSKNDNMQELQARMRRYAGELFESNDTAFDFEFENVSEGDKLNMQQRRDLYLIFKECLNNICKHASATRVAINIVVSNGILKMLIEDDGKGFDPNNPTDRNGIKNMETRIEKWKGTLMIDSLKGRGTKIRIIMPVKNPLLK